MASDVRLQKLRSELANVDAIRTDPFGLLGQISALVNSQATHSVGREMVIRALAVQEHLPSDHKTILQSLVKAVGLVPYLDRDSSLDFYDRVLVEAHRPPIREQDLLFHTLQLQIYRDLIAGRNVVLSAATSVGKSLVVDAVIASGKHHHLAIIVPTIALIDETRRRLSKRFGSEFDVITHPTQTSDKQRRTIFILTQERVLSRSDLSEVSFFVIDEFYKLDLRNTESDRTVDLNLCFHRLAKAGAQFYLIGPNIDGVSGIGGKYDYTFIPSRFSTVALDVAVYGLPRDDQVRCEKLIEILTALLTPTLIYCQSPSKAALVAEALISSGLFNEVAATAEAVDWLRKEYPREWVFTRALQFGIGIHHGNIPRALQQYVVRAFEQGHIRFIVCTSTIIEGVNTVAENVIIYDKRIGSPNLDSFTFKNIAGRAGRMTKYFIGKVFVLESPPTEESSYAVKVDLYEQNIKTPVSLIVDLPEEDLTPISRVRIQEITSESPLTITTLRLNRHIPIEDQVKVFRAISRDVVLLQDTLAWKGFPESHQLTAVCNLIYTCLDQGRTLGAYGITSGIGLKAELDRIRTAKSFRQITEHWVERRRQDDSISDAVEKALRFMRRYVCFTFPRQLMAISHIQAEVNRRAGHQRFGDYSLFAAKAESLFMDPGLFALDEYGIPTELARRLGRQVGEVGSLEAGLKLLRIAGVDDTSLHPFERDIIRDVLETVSV